jgi:hypothetical protein
MEFQDHEFELEFLLSRLSDPPFQLVQPPIRDEARPSERYKRLHIK